MVKISVMVGVRVSVRSIVRVSWVLGQGTFRVRVGVRVCLGLRVRVIVRVRISVVVRVSTTQNVKCNH